MATFRIVWEFDENNGATFSEVYYTDAASAAAAAVVGPILFSARLALLHPLNTWRRIRSSQVDQPRITAVVPFNAPGTSVVTGGPLAVGASVVSNLGSNSGKTRKLWMRGCCRGDYTRNNTTGRDDPTADLLTRLNEFYLRLDTNVYGMRTIIPNGAGLVGKKRITLVDGSLIAGSSSLTIQGIPIYPVGSRVLIGGASLKDLPALNGQWTVLDQTGAVTVIGYETPQRAAIGGGLAYIRAAQYHATDPFAFGKCGFDHMGTRTSRNPLSHSRGARRAVRIRSLV
jgi:hypothetical protein